MRYTQNMKFHIGLPILICLLTLQSTSAWSQKKTETAQSGDPSPTQPAQTSHTDKPQRPPASAQRPISPKNAQATMNILAEDLPADAFVWLNKDTDSYLAVWQPDRSGSPKGALLIIPAEGESPVWPRLSKPLHDTLPDYGWATLAISLPLPEAPTIPARTLPVKTIAVAAETSADGKTKTTTKPTTPPTPQVADTTLTTQLSAEEATEQRLEEALRFLHDKGQFNVILLGSGTGAIRAQYFLEKITPKVANPRLKAALEKPVRALVIVNGRNRLHADAVLFKDWFSDTEIPVLDIFLDTDTRNHQDAKRRQVLARQKNVATYKQVKIPALSHEHNWGENRLSRRIRSFLDNNAVGIEVDNATLHRQ